MGGPGGTGISGPATRDLARTCGVHGRSCAACSWSFSAHTPALGCSLGAACTKLRYGWLRSTALCHPPVQALVLLEAARKLLLGIVLYVAPRSESEPGGTERPAWVALMDQITRLERRQLRRRRTWEQLTGRMNSLLESRAYKQAAAARARAAARGDALTRLRVAQAVVVLRGCSNLSCTTVRGASEAQARGQRCSRCGFARFCSEACARAGWATHAPVCSELTAAAAAAAGQDG